MVRGIYQFYPDMSQRLMQVALSKIKAALNTLHHNTNIGVEPSDAKSRYNLTLCDTKKI